MSHEIIPKKLSSKKISDAGLALILITLILDFYTGKDIFRNLGILFLLIVMTVPTILKPWAFFWYSFSGVLGFVMSNLILSIIYISFVVPMGLVRQMLGKDSLKLKQFKKKRSSVFINRVYTFSKKDLDKTY